MLATKDKFSNNTDRRSRWWWCIKQYASEEEMLEFRLPTAPPLVYAAWRFHEAPTTGQLHVHVLLHFKTQVSFGRMQELGFQNLKWVNTLEQKRNYRGYLIADNKPDGRPKGVLGCLEEQGTWDEGTSQGKRNDLLDCATMLKTGSPMKQVAEMFPTTYIRNHNGLRNFQAMVTQIPVRTSVKVIVHYGDSGSGKTHKVFADNKLEDIFRLPMGEKLWFDGYSNQKILLIDDSVKRFKYHELLQYLDYYPLTIPVKGAFVHAQWTTVYITMVDPPNHWYKGYDQQLERRLTEIWYFQGKYPNSTVTKEKPLNAFQQIQIQNPEPLLNKPYVTLDDTILDSEEFSTTEEYSCNSPKYQ